ncbi:DUF6998 domain-containing protein [Camelimonas abortus]|uniref:DUF6998 domain-containing protein n=1 Tax=Camelimonas abortus TaxID=1017184 RepID=UPI0035F04DFA
MPYRRHFRLPPIVAELVSARNKLRSHYAAVGLRFTLDGNLVGDIGEAVACELFGLRILSGNGTGVDAQHPDGRTVQIKATGTGRGPVFRCVNPRADHLLFFEFDFEALSGEIVFNGPESIAIAKMPSAWVGQRPVTKVQIRAADQLVPIEDRLKRVDIS